MQKSTEDFIERLHDMLSEDTITYKLKKLVYLLGCIGLFFFLIVCYIVNYFFYYYN